jgi:hypothetical protein
MTMASSTIVIDMERRLQEHVPSATIDSVRRLSRIQATDRQSSVGSSTVLSSSSLTNSPERTESLLQHDGEDNSLSEANIHHNPSLLGGCVDFDNEDNAGARRRMRRSFLEIQSIPSPSGRLQYNLVKGAVERRQEEHQEKRKSSVWAKVSAALFVCDLQENKIDLNAWNRLDEQLSRSQSSLIPPEASSLTTASDYQDDEGGDSPSAFLKHAVKQESKKQDFWIATSVNTLLDNQEKVDANAAFREILPQVKQQRQREEQLRILASDCEDGVYGDSALYVLDDDFDEDNHVMHLLVA